MEVTYDQKANVAYIRLREQGAEVETIRVSDELNVDIAPDGSVYGIELLNANEQIAVHDGARFTLRDAVTGQRVDVPFPGGAA